MQSSPPASLVRRESLNAQGRQTPPLECGTRHSDTTLVSAVGLYMWLLSCANDQYSNNFVSAIFD